MKTFTKEEIVTEIKKYNGWEYVNECLEKNFQFKDFSEALSFIVKVGIVAEKLNHHPELWNVYNKVNLKISTHDANGITEKDFLFVKNIDTL